MRIAIFGGLYSNYLALSAAIRDVQLIGADAIYCLGDLGAFGPYPDRTIDLVREHAITCIQGNYDDSIGNALDNCQCGYTDARDNYFAQLSYDYTLAGTSAANRAWLKELPQSLRLDLAGQRVLLCHGSPRRTNEFLWESTTSTAFLDHLAAGHQADLMVATHTGMKWHRTLAGGRQFINVGVLGRPENDGQTHVWYAMLSFNEGTPAAAVTVEFRPVVYDHIRLAREMAQEKLPSEFQATILTGWWTTCLEVLPAKERRRGRF